MTKIPDEMTIIEPEQKADKPNAWKAGRPPKRTSKVNRGDNEGGKLAVRADPMYLVPERDDAAYKDFATAAGGKEGLKDLLSWSENPKAQKLLQVLDSKSYKTYGIKALAKRCGITLPELYNLFREKSFRVTYMKLFVSMPEITQGAIDDATPSKDICPVCKYTGHIKRDGYEVKCPKCNGTGEIRVSGDKEARRDVFKAVGLIKDSPQVVTQQIGNVTIEGVDNFEDLMRSAAKTAKKIERNGKEEAVQDAEIIE